MKLSITRDISGEVRDPTLLAGWPGMGSVGAGAINYMRETLGMQPFAEVDAREYFTPDSVVVEDGLTKFPDTPSNTFYYHQEADLIIFESESQLSGDGGTALMRIILDLAEQLGVGTIYTGAAFAVPSSHREPSHVYAVANSKELKNLLAIHDLEILAQGQISGLNGLLLGFAGLRGIEAACLLATMPQHAMNMPNPKASRELIRCLKTILGLEVAMAKINKAVGQMNKTMIDIEEKIRATFLNKEAGDEEVEMEDLDEEKVPHYVMEKIEHMFREVRDHKSNDKLAINDKAAQLKAELDRWNLYVLYEDRFLDLFR